MGKDGGDVRARREERGREGREKRREMGVTAGKHTKHLNYWAG